MENRIKEWRQKRGLTLQALADLTGTTRSQIDKLERGSRRLTAEWMVRLAKPLGCDPRELLDLAQMPLAGVALPAIPLRVLVREKGECRFAPDAVDRIPCPPFLLHAKDAYGFYVIDDDLSPMFRPRQLLYVNPYRPPVVEGGVVAIGKDGSVLVACFLKQKGDKLYLRSFHPTPRDFTLSLSRLAATHAVVGSQETL